MELNHYHHPDNVIVIQINGSLIGTALPELNEYVKPILQEINQDSSIDGLVLDLANVSFLDSSGIGWICGKMIKLKKIDKVFGICHIPPNVWKILEMAGIVHKLEVYLDK